MNRGDAYQLLAGRLEAFRGLGFDELRSLVNQAATTETVRLGEEDVAVEIVVSWSDDKHITLRITASAYGPSSWKMDRLDESIVVGPDGR